MVPMGKHVSGRTTAATTSSGSQTQQATVTRGRTTLKSDTSSCHLALVCAVVTGSGAPTVHWPVSCTSSRCGPSFRSAGVAVIVLNSTAAAGLSVWSAGFWTRQRLTLCLILHHLLLLLCFCHCRKVMNGTLIVSAVKFPVFLIKFCDSSLCIHL